MALVLTRQRLMIWSSLFTAASSSHIENCRPCSIRCICVSCISSSSFGKPKQSQVQSCCYSTNWRSRSFTWRHSKKQDSMWNLPCCLARWCQCFVKLRIQILWFGRTFLSQPVLADSTGSPLFWGAIDYPETERWKRWIYSLIFHLSSAELLGKLWRALIWLRLEELQRDLDKHLSTTMWVGPTRDLIYIMCII